MTQKQVSKMIGKYLSSGFVPKAEINVVAEELKRFEAKYGKLNPKIVLDEAKKKYSPLHKYFQWDNNKAAEQFRLQQARSLVECVVEVIVCDKKEIEIRTFQSVYRKGDEDKKEPVYVTIQTALKTNSYRKDLVREMITTATKLKEKLELFLSYEK